jgi:hypothetical protein
LTLSLLFSLSLSLSLLSSSFLFSLSLSQRCPSLRKRLKKVVLPADFPSRQVVEAYLQPDVDGSREAFQWGVPRWDALKLFAQERFRWLFCCSFFIFYFLFFFPFHHLLSSYFQSHLSPRAFFSLFFGSDGRATAVMPLWIRSWNG